MNIIGLVATSALVALATLSPGRLSSQQIHPRWSPDGVALVTFERIRDSSTVSIWSTDQLESRVVASGAWFANPSWSPDQNRLAVAFGANGMRSEWRLAIIDLETGEIAQLPDFPGREMHTSWSPDGRWIAFVINTGEGSDVHLIRPDGTGHRQLTDTPHSEFHPKWSFDGRWLAFDRHLEDDLGQIAILEVSTGDTKVVVLPLDVGAGTPSFHPNGTEITFSHRKGGENEIASVGVDGTRLRVHTAFGGFNGAPVWSPDAKTLAFHHDGTREAGVYLLDMESGVVKLLGNAPQ